jgi:hypothetical protein
MNAKPAAQPPGNGKPDDPGKGPKPKEVTIEVNDKPVPVEERDMTGAEIKAAAIAKGVQIQPTFVLYLDLANGTSETVGNDQHIRIHPHMSFSAIAPDDNS